MNLTELEESLSRPSEAAVEALRGLTGDLVVLGAGGKMGPSLCRMARRALDEIGTDRQVIAVARFSDPSVRDSLNAAGVPTIASDLLDRSAVARLPDAGAVAHLVAMKFGTTGREALTWALNAWVPGLVADRYSGVPTVVFSSGNVYPFVPVASGGADEEHPISPVGEYAQSVVARERIFEHFSRTHGTPTMIYRLNYASELRYGVPLDIALRVRFGLPVELANGHFNAIWQGDANAAALACFGVVDSPPRILNVTGPETLSVREIARHFGAKFGREPVFAGTENDTALLSDATRFIQLFGPPTMPIPRLLDLIEEWVRSGGSTHDKPTHFEVRDGAF